MFNVEIKGLNQVLSNTEKYSKDLANGIDQELSTAAENVAVMAKVRAPKGRTGELVSSISANISTKFSKSISASAPHAPFVEFGTGVRVFKTPEFNFTPEVRAYAREFFVSGKGRQFPHPFLFPSLEVEKPRLITRIKERLFTKQVL